MLTCQVSNEVVNECSLDKMLTVVSNEVVNECSLDKMLTLVMRW